MLTLDKLKDLKKKNKIWLHLWDSNKGKIRVYVKRGKEITQNEWRKFILELKKRGFKHIGGPNPWMCDWEDGRWMPLGEDESY